VHSAGLGSGSSSPLIDEDQSLRIGLIPLVAPYRAFLLAAVTGASQVSCSDAETRDDARHSDESDAHVVLSLQAGTGLGQCLIGINRAMHEGLAAHQYYWVRDVYPAFE
jgi:hypothetical protein